MGAGEGVAAVLAPSAGTRIDATAEEPLAQPEREPLLAGPGRAVQEEGAGEGVAADRVVEPRAQAGVAMERKKGHGVKGILPYPRRERRHSS